MATVFPRVKTAKPEPDAWLDKLLADCLSPARLVIGGGALVAFVWFVVSFITGTLRWW
jgi:hypothetical protein